MSSDAKPKLAPVWGTPIMAKVEDSGRGLDRAVGEVADNARFAELRAEAQREIEKVREGHRRELEERDMALAQSEASLARVTGEIQVRDRTERKQAMAVSMRASERWTATWSKLGLGAFAGFVATYLVLRTTRKEVA